MSRTRISRKTNCNFEIKPRVIIIADGDTERDYINRLTQIKYFENVNLKFEKGDENNFIIKLQEHLNNIDNVFLILDIDCVQAGKRYNKLSNLINNTSYNIFYNNYSFETWLLNHKTMFSSPIHYSYQYNNAIKRCFAVESWNENKNEANRKAIMNKINCADIDLAQINIRTISSNRWNENPSSNMDSFVNKIRLIK